MKLNRYPFRLQGLFKLLFRNTGFDYKYEKIITMPTKLRSPHLRLNTIYLI